MAHTRQCKLCGIKTQKLAVHIAEQHPEYLENRDTYVAVAKEVFGISKGTAIIARKLAGFRNIKYCPRCGKEREGMVRHILECHMPILMCARYSLGLEQKDIAAMFFNGGVSRDTISYSFQLASHERIECEGLPKYVIPITIEDGAIRQMSIGEVGRGLIFADPGVSW